MFAYVSTQFTLERLHERCGTNSCNQLFLRKTRNVLHSLSLREPMNHELACWRRLTPMQSSVFAQRFAAPLCARRVTLQALCFRFRPRSAGALLCACSYRGIRTGRCDVLNKSFLHKKKAAMRRPCIGYFSLKARVSSGHNVMA